MKLRVYDLVKLVSEWQRASYLEAGIFCLVYVYVFTDKVRQQSANVLCQLLLVDSGHCCQTRSPKLSTLPANRNDKIEAFSYEELFL